jgi:hypothetical protein
MKGSGNVKDRIIKPFERDMTALSPTIIWEYQNGERPASYNDFMAANVVIHWNDYPVSARRIESGTGQVVRQLADKSGIEQISLFDELILDQLMQLFDNRETAEEIFSNAKNKYPDIDITEYITKNIEYAKKKKKNVKNIRCYLRKAIENDYAEYRAQLQKRAEEQLKEEERKLREEYNAKLAELAEIERQQESDRIEKEMLENIVKDLKRINLSEQSKIWQNCLNTIEKDIDPSDFTAWFSIGRLFADRVKNFYVVLPSNFHVIHVEKHFDNIIKASFSKNNVDFLSLNIMTAESVKKHNESYKVLSEHLKLADVVEHPELLKKKLNIVQEKYPKQFTFIKTSCKHLFVDGKKNMYIIVPHDMAAKCLKVDNPHIIKNVFSEVKLDNIVDMKTLVERFF